MARRVSSPGFVGRDQEVALLDSTLARAVRSEPHTLLIGGEAGVGKTRLIDEFAARARATGATVVVGHCIEISHGDLPFAPIAEAFRALLRSLDDSEIERIVGNAGPELARLLPELGLEDTPSQVSGADQGRLFELLFGILERVGERSPVVLVIEDLHWADGSTRDLLSFLARSVRRARLLVIATYRSDELHRRHPLKPFLAELQRSGRSEWIDLARLGRSEVTEQIGGIIGAPPEHSLIERVFALSEGNPFFVEELVATGTDAGNGGLPQTLSDALMVRVETVSEATQGLLGVAAVAGRRVQHRLLSEIAALDEPTLLASLREAVANHLLVADPDDGYAFRHALLREAVYEDLLPGERTRLHGTFAGVLTASPELAGGSGATAVAELAYHFYAAHDLEAALKSSVQAARASERAYAFPEARRHYERALELWDKVPNAADVAASDLLSLVRAAAECAHIQADLEHAVAFGRQALDLIDPVTDPVSAGLVHERLGRYEWVRGRSKNARNHYREAVRLLPAEPPSAPRARVLAAQGQVLMLAGRFEDSRAPLEEAVAMARAVGAQDVVGHALNSLAVSRAMLGEPDQGIAYLLEARRIATEMGNPEDIGRSYANLPEVLMAAGRFEDAVADYREGIEVLRGLGLERTFGIWLRSDLAQCLFTLGRWDEVDRLLDSVAASAPFELGVGHMNVVRARLLTGRGEYDVAAEALARAEELLAEALDPQDTGPLHQVKIELAIWQHRYDDARRAIAQGFEAMADVDEIGFSASFCALGLRVEADAIEAARTHKDGAAIDAATSAGKELLERARTFGERAVIDGYVFNLGVVARAASCEAEWSRLEGSPDPDLWADAAARWAELKARPEIAYTRWREAEACLVAGSERGRAESALRDAHGVARALGARSLLDEIELLALRGRVDLAAPGEEPAAPAPSPVDRLGLTPREIEVLRLVAGGRTNPEIAKELFISEKTASVHVSHILAKLGVSRRVEAAGIAHKLGFTGDRG